MKTSAEKLFNLLFVFWATVNLSIYLWIVFWARVKHG